jgi:ATP-dependent exoDNAse (exonuclease V) beta subunit
MSGPAPPASSLTDQQRRAVFTREVSVVLSSGAGCGKTHVLTERYLSHLRHDGACPRPPTSAPTPPSFRRCASACPTRAGRG